MAWISKGEYRRLLRQLARAERRADQAESALYAEREHRMADIRHLVSMLLRRANSYPLPTAQPAEPAPVPDTDLYADQPMDPGEYEALLEAGLAMGLSQQDIEAKLAAERPF